MFIIYFLISFISSVIGAISGIGGGVIIKPLLDSFSPYDVGSISFLSGNTVLAMTATALFRNRKSEIRLEKKTSSCLAAGGVSGGIGGKFLFDMIRQKSESDMIVGISQSLILAVLPLGVLFFTLYKNRIPSVKLKNTAFYLFAGILLGGIASFLGIGGGPINLAVLYLVFSMDSKTAALNSINIIFFSQLTNLIFTILSGNIPSISPVILTCMITGGIGGGLLGSYYSGKMTHRHVDYLFSGVMTIIIGLSIYNILRYLTIIA